MRGRWPASQPVSSLHPLTSQFPHTCMHACICIHTHKCTHMLMFGCCIHAVAYVCSLACGLMIAKTCRHTHCVRSACRAEGGQVQKYLAATGVLGYHKPETSEPWCPLRHASSSPVRSWRFLRTRYRPHCLVDGWELLFTIVIQVL